MKNFFNQFKYRFINSSREIVLWTGLILWWIIFPLTLFHFTPFGKFNQTGTETIYLLDNGFHAEIGIPEGNGVTSYGWGSKIFFYETPTWDDVTPKIALKALFTKPTSVVRVTKHSKINPKWIKIKCSKKQFNTITANINDAFTLKDNKRVSLNRGYFMSDKHYWALNTCNTWINSILQEAELPCVVYTLFSSRILNQYK